MTFSAWIARVAAVVTLATALAYATPAVADTAADRVVIGDGHIDMGPRFVKDAWTIEIRDDTVDPVVWRDPDNVVLQAVDASQLPVPDDARFSFLGKPGDPIWLLPQVQKAGVLWPGWNTQDAKVATTVRREVTWTLHGVRGPGTFVLFLNEEFGQPETVFDSRKAYPQQTGIDVDTHVHDNWAFSEPGSYLLDISMAGVTNEGQDVSDRTTVRIFVGDGNAASAFDVSATPSPSAQPSTSSGATTRGADSDGGRFAGSAVWIGGGAAAVLLVVAVIVAVAATRRRRNRVV